MFVTLQDGRRLAYREQGLTGNDMVFQKSLLVLHGTPSSRLAGMPGNQTNKQNSLANSHFVQVLLLLLLVPWFLSFQAILLLDLQNPTSLKFQSIEIQCKLVRLIAYVSQMGRRNFLTCISLSLMAKLTLRYYSFLMKFSFSFEKNCNRRITMDHFEKNCN